MVYRQTKNQNTLKSLQKDLQFHMMDDLLNNYIALEKIYINHALEDGFRKDKQNFITESQHVLPEFTKIERGGLQKQI